MKEVGSGHGLKAIGVNMGVSLRSLFGNKNMSLGLQMDVNVAVSGRVPRATELSVSAEFRSIDSRPSYWTRTKSKRPWVHFAAKKKKN